MPSLSEVKSFYGCFRNYKHCNYIASGTPFCPRPFWSFHSSDTDFLVLCNFLLLVIFQTKTAKLKIGLSLSVDNSQSMKADEFIAKRGRHISIVNFSSTVFYRGINLDVDKDEDVCSILLYIYLMFSVLTVLSCL